ncbi:protein-L-isoaspartate O-methyltransferase [Sphingomonas sp. BGYR3]|uniref:protein-L-isoaspartate O-methyltransferase family protein n=1 Tax=Sphingomonas sp. BGYR3 TaxID=2975483 RepID=UPI0021A45124|nr:methyltransferase domain-containing protein [Sphingomonas sp. BGYR3]MDG5488430.1 protein-L-isoaspartate O-methyltransferase [Sphingomonas sp. BGYR3]
MVDQAALSPNAATMRQAMVVSQLRPSAVNDVRVVTAMGRLPRERFLPAEHRAIAYRDTLLPLGEGRLHNSPLATGRLLTEARLRADDRVLVIGAAGGYSAAVAAEIVASVVALEQSPALAATARLALADIAHVELVEGPLAAGWADAGPYDVILIDGAVEHLPDAIIEQLKPGGRLVTGISDRGVTRLAFGERTAGGFGLVNFADIDCPELPGFAVPRGFTF